MKAETQINSETTNHTFRPIQQKDNPQVANVIRRVMTEFHCVGRRLFHSGSGGGRHVQYLRQ